MRRLSFSVRPLAALRRRLSLVRDECGFTLIEMVLATAIFIGVAAGLAGVLGSSIVAHDLARERTFSQQAATAQIECIRRLAYQDVGLYPSGNPTGRIGDTTGGNYCNASPFTISKTGIQATMVTTVTYVDDPGPTSYSTAANYKKVTVTVTRADGMVLASQATFVAPIQRAPFGGINNAILNVLVKDFALNAALPDATVALASGPSAPLTGNTDSTGLVSFAALTPTTSSGAATDYYDITATKSGYVTLAADLPPALEAHKQLAPTATVPATIRLYKPATINLAVTNGVGGPAYAGVSKVKITSSLTSTTQTYSVPAGGVLSVTSFGGQPVVSGVQYTVRGYTTTGSLCSDADARSVPESGYPTNVTTSYTVALKPCVTGSLTVNVTQLGGPAIGAAVTVSGGPNDFDPIIQTTNSSGLTTFTNLPSGTDTYAISVTDVAGQVTGSGSATVATGATTSTTIALANPPMGSINALVQWFGSNVSGATVTVTGGPYNISLSGGPTGGSGTVSFSNNVPAGTGYTVTATKNGQTATATSVTVTAGSTTSRTLAMPTGTINVSATWLSIAADNATVSITGGPNGGTYPGTTSVSGTVAIAVPATTASYPYVVSVTKYGGTGTASVPSVPSGGSAAAAVTMGGVGTITVSAATWGGKPVNAGTVSISGGPNGGPYTGTTNASGISGAINVPATSASFPAYNVTVTKNTGAPSPVPTVTSVTNGGNTNISVVLLPVKSVVITVQKSAGVAAGAGVVMRISLSGGPVGTAGVAPFYSYGVTTAGASPSTVTITNVPVATGFTYTVKADIYNGTTCPALTNKSTTAGSLSAAAATTTMTLVLNSTTCPLTPWPQ
jgi:large repetitive protein